MLKALERVRELDVSMICPGHGPVLDSGIDFIEDTYERWCTVVNPNQKNSHYSLCKCLWLYKADRGKD